MRLRAGRSRTLQTWLTEDVPGWVSEHLRVAPEREAWAWIGFSAGGWCSAMATMLNPDRFGAAVVMSGYFQPWWEGPPPPTLSADQLARLDLVALASNNPPDVAMRVQVNRPDDEFYRATTKFLDAVEPPLSVTGVIDETGGHAMSSWQAQVTPSLQWLATHVEGFRPAS